jgi:hypothetical protein
MRMIALAIPDTVKEKYKTVLDWCRFLELASPRLMQELDTWNWHSSLKEIGKNVQQLPRLRLRCSS